jgi:uncharacterized membrane protein
MNNASVFQPLFQNLPLPIRRDLPFLALITLALTWCITLVSFRIAWTHRLEYIFLIWNLALASAPLFFSTLFLAQTNKISRSACAFFWLLFFPNAPYIITDFVHLRTIQSAPIWFDILLLASSAATALAIGYHSLSQIHDHFTAAHHKTTGWLIAITAIALSSFGIYLGRFLRWRSIDIALNPLGLLTDIFDRFLHPLAHPRTWGVTLGFTTLLLFGYLLFRQTSFKAPGNLFSHQN